MNIPIAPDIPPLVAGDFLTRAEFMRRWEAMLHVKFAELIGGVVYMASPVGREHGSTDICLATWVGSFVAATPGCEAFSNATWLMDKGAVTQPETSLRIRPECGGQSSDDGNLAAGAPEFLDEVCVSSTSYDLHQKLEVYEATGVREYLAVLVREREVLWHRLEGGKFTVIPLPADGIHRSVVFPGLWLDAAALLAGDLARVLAVLNDGLRTPEHQAFVLELHSRRSRPR